MRVPTLRGVFAAAGLAILVASAVAGAQGPRSAATAIPKVTGPLPVTVDSRPFLGADHGLPPIDLGKFGYVEEEFLVSGAANVYDWATDGSVTVKTANAPYTTRILVRRPAASARFSGAVIVEPMYPARRWDWSMMWGYSHDYFMEHGDAWVGVTLPASVAGLQKFNPTRYGSLSFKNPTPDVTCPTGRGANAASDVEEGLRWDMLSQVGALLKSGGTGRPLNGFRVQSIYLTTQGGDLTTYLNAIHPHAMLENGKPVYDGYLAKAPYNAARINQCAAAPGAGDPRQIVKNAGVPVIAVAAQGEVPGTYASRRPDSDDLADRYRLYEVAGAGHIDRSAYIGFPPMADQTAAGNALGSAEWPFAAPCDPAIPLIDTPIMSLAFNAAFANLDRWVRQGTPAPRAARLDTKEGGTAPPSLVTDQFGHGVGGMRTPYIDVPAASYATNSPGPGNCREMGSKSSFDRARMAALYGNEKSYAAKVAQAADRLVKEHWLTEGDARRVKAESTAPWR
ncbi:MAG: alpha/beta hydrolase domain-containing protein [Acidobacteriota bacterium]